MTDNDANRHRKPAPLVERRVRRIVNARSVTISFALTFVALALVGAIVMWVVDPHNFPSLGLAIWWALQTVTTVGYGDVVPTTTLGRTIGGIEMVLGVSFISFLTAAVTSTVIQRANARTHEDNRAHREHNTHAILDGITSARDAIAELGKRLDRIESKIDPRAREDHGRYT
jgi:voltage-gated potassium channel